MRGYRAIVWGIAWSTPLWLAMAFIWSSEKVRLSCTLSTVRSCARYEFIEGNKAIRTKYLCDTSYTRQLHNKSMSFSSAKTPRRQDRAHLTLSARLVSLDRTVWEYHTWAALSFRPFLTKVLYQEIGIERHKLRHSKRSSNKTLKRHSKAFKTTANKRIYHISVTCLTYFVMLVQLL